MLCKDEPDVSLAALPLVTAWPANAKASGGLEMGVRRGVFPAVFVRAGSLQARVLIVEPLPLEAKVLASCPF